MSIHTIVLTQHALKIPHTHTHAHTRTHTHTHAHTRIHTYSPTHTYSQSGDRIMNQLVEISLLRFIHESERKTFQVY